MSNYKTKISSSREAFEQNNIDKHDLVKKKLKTNSFCYVASYWVI